MLEIWTKRPKVSDGLFCIKQLQTIKEFVKRSLPYI